MMRGRSSMVGFDSFNPSFGAGFWDFDEYNEEDKAEDDAYDFGDRYADPSRAHAHTHAHNSTGSALHTPLTAHTHNASSTPAMVINRASSFNSRLGLSNLRYLSVSANGNANGKMSSTSMQQDFPHKRGAQQDAHEPEPSIDHTLVSPPPEWALCSICHEIFKTPTVTRCGHTFCHGCIMEVINRKGSCPLCRQKIEGPLDLNMNYQMAQVIGGLMVHCKYGMKLRISASQSNSFPPSSSSHTALSSSSPSSPEDNSTPPHPRMLSISVPITSYLSEPAVWLVESTGCTEIFEYGEREKHETQCEHAPAQCFNEGCFLKVKRKDLETHMSECPYRVLKCSLCSEMLQFQHEEKHSLHCPEKTIYCPHACGASFFRRQQADHARECPTIEITCPHASFGCRFSGKRELHNDHLASCPYEGLKDYLLQTKSQIEQLMNITHAQQKEIKTLKASMAAQASEIASLRAAPPPPPQRSRSSGFRSFLNNPFDDRQNH